MTKCDFCGRDITDINQIGFHYFDDGIEHTVCNCCWGNVIRNDVKDENKKESKY